jgi:hypothetical protein
MWQLHNKRFQLGYLFQRVENCIKAIDSVDVAAAFKLLCSIAEVYFCELLYFAHLFDTIVTDTAML